MNDRRRIAGIIPAFFFIFLILGSCLKDDFDFSKLAAPTLEPDLAAPLIHSNLLLSKILPKGSLIVEDPNTHMLTLVYETELISLKAEDYITIPEQHSTSTNMIPAIVFSPGLDTTLSYDRNLLFLNPESGQRIDSFFIKTARINFDFSSNINHNFTITVSIPTAKKNNIPFKAVFEHTYTGTLPVTGNVALDFSGYKIKLNQGPSDSTIIPVHFEINVTGDNNSNFPPYSFTLNTEISQIRFERIYGYLGQFEYPLSDSLELGIFKNTFTGHIQFGDLKLSLQTRNSIGMPMQLKVNEIKAYSSKVPPYMVDLIDNPDFPNPLVFYSPDVYHAGQTVITNYTFTPFNCNLNEALNISPQYMHFDITGKSNPDGNPAAENFVLDSSRFSIVARVDLPFFGAVSDFSMEDTLDFTFNDITNIDEFAFRMVTMNRFPVNIQLQAYFADSQYHILDSLIYDQNYVLIKAAAVGGAPLYRIIEDPPPPVYTYLPKPLNRERLSRLANCKKMLIRAGLSSTNNGLVKIYSDYNLDVRMGARVTINY
ncbi:MAG: hypothetical protein NTU44_17130 [Bacteroidetes bacterium]|nr:hypothetical protein [Bacteroidota bacterium]